MVPIVRSHHEKWDGSGYPDGLAGEQIPIGARILAAVDCLDALASDRQYRRALPLDEAMAKVAKEAGTSFDPAVVAVLQRRYRELEGKARELDAGAEPALSTNICITRGAAPAAGFETEASRAPAAPAGSSDASTLPALQGLTLEEELAVAAVRIKRVIAYDAVAFYVRDGEVLRSVFAAGSHSGGLGNLNVPIGMGLVGWVAEASQPIINGNPTVEPGYARDEPSGALRSALAIPVLDSSNRTLAVLAVYHCDMDAFSSQQVNALMALSRPLAQTMELKESDSRRAIFAKLSSGPFPGHFLAPENIASSGVH